MTTAPPAATPTREWRSQARCRDTDPAVFFPPGEAGSAATAPAERRAKAICRMCAVEVDCLRYALDAGERDGVWGGLSAAERARRRYRWS